MLRAFVSLSTHSSPRSGAEVGADGRYEVGPIFTTVPASVSKNKPGSFEFVFIASSPGSKLEFVGLFPKTEERLKIIFVADMC
jgi:hypothetical protein